jgi:DtxR family Mn-dependent transcriptional regulator
MLKRLRDAGLVDYAPHRGARLSARGRTATMRVLRRHRLVETFLVEVLGLDWSEVHEEADVLEHHLSDRLVEAIDRRLGHPTEDPHGSPIPSVEGVLEQRHLVPLASIEPGGGATVREVHEDESGRLRRWKELGLVPGARVEVVAHEEMDEVIRLRVGRRRVILSPRAVEGIEVEPWDE